MIDYLKILILDNNLIQQLFNHTLLTEYSVYKKVNSNFDKKLKKEIKVIKANYNKIYNGVLFCFYTKTVKNEVYFNKVEIFLKPHYYFNNNLHNANDFTSSDCINVLSEIKEKFNLPTEKLIILNIEFGVNIVSPINAKKLIECTIYHDKNKFNNSSDDLKYSIISFKHNPNGNANKYKMIKFYAKGLQFPEYTDIDTIRFEIKSKKRRYLQTQLYIYTYCDLLKIETYHLFVKHLKKEIKGLLILDYYNKMNNLNFKERKKLEKYNNSITWFSALQGSKNTFNNTKKRYFKLLDKTNNNIHKKLIKVIENKLDELI